MLTHCEVLPLPAAELDAGFVAQRIAQADGGGAGNGFAGYRRTGAALTLHVYRFQFAVIGKRRQRQS